MRYYFFKGGVFMVRVKKLPGQSDDQLIRNFSKKVMDAGIVQEENVVNFTSNLSCEKASQKAQTRRSSKD